MVTPLFNCSQALMYQTTKTMWVNCKEYITQMGQFKKIYTVAYCDERIAEIEAAEAMKSLALRTLQHEMIRVELVDLANEVRANFQALKQYIAGVYKDKQMREMNYRAAGWGSYEAASDNNWVSVQQLINEGNQYLTLNKSILEADDNMPNTFTATYADAGVAFNLKLASFTQAQETAGVETDAKNIANNDVYQQAIDMGLDGQFVLRKDESKRKQFSFEAVSDLIEPRGASTLVVELRDAETNAVVNNFEVVNLETQRSVEATDGRAEMGQQAAGENKQYKVMADGYPDKFLTVNIGTGVKVIEKLSLVPLITAAAKAEIAETATAPVNTPELVPVQ